MRPTVYIETSIPSAYVDERQDIITQFQRHETREWWTRYGANYRLATSEAVLAELSRAEFPGQAEALRLLENIPVLPVTDEVRGVAHVYVEHLVMPSADMGDAFHLAFACVHEMDYLLTWNCRHLANPSKARHVAAINRRLGLLTPIMLTPQMLVEESTDED